MTSIEILSPLSPSLAEPGPANASGTAAARPPRPAFADSEAQSKFNSASTSQTAQKQVLLGTAVFLTALYLIGWLGIIKIA